MRSASFLLLATLTAASGQLRRNSEQQDDSDRNLRDVKFMKLGDREHYLENMKPATVGEFHTDAFHKLGEVYAEKGPQSDFQLMQDVSEVMASFCPSRDSFCDAFVYKATLEEFIAANTDGTQNTYPVGFNEDVKEALHITETMIDSLSANNVDDVVDELDIIINDLENMKNVDSDEQAIAIASVSVAKESTKLWYDAMTNSDNKLHNLVLEKAEHARRRRLQEDEESILTIVFEGVYWDGLFGQGGLLQGVVKADYQGTLNGGLELLDSVPENPLLLWPWNWPILGFYVAAFHSIPASAQFMLEPIILLSSSNLWTVQVHVCKPLL